MGSFLNLPMYALERVHPAITATVALAMLFGGFAIAVSVGTPEQAEPVFHSGELVTMKVDGTRVMVYGARWCYPKCSYSVRLPGSLDLITVSEIEIAR